MGGTGEVEDAAEVEGEGVRELPDCLGFMSRLNLMRLRAGCGSCCGAENSRAAETGWSARSEREGEDEEDMGTGRAARPAGRANGFSFVSFFFSGPGTNSL